MIGKSECFSSIIGFMFVGARHSSIFLGSYKENNAQSEYVSWSVTFSIHALDIAAVRQDTQRVQHSRATNI